MKVIFLRKLNIFAIILTVLLSFESVAFAYEPMIGNSSMAVFGNVPGIMVEPVYTAARADLPGWAIEDFDRLNTAGIIPVSLMEKNLSRDITRLDFCRLLAAMYRAIMGNSEDPELVKVPCDDCDDPDVSLCYTLGLIGTVGENVFDPTGHITREEMAVAMIGMIEACGINAAPTVEELSDVCSYEDFPEASVWAYNALTRAVADGYLSGTKNKLLPLEDATIAQVISAAGKIFASYAPDAEAYKVPEIQKPYDGDEITGNFGVVVKGEKDAVKHHIIVKDANYDNVLSVSTLGKSVYVDTEYFVDGETYTIYTASEYKDSGMVFSMPHQIVFKKPHKANAVSAEERASKEARVFSGGEAFSTYEEAKENMCTISVPVWRLSANGEKIAATHSLTVNKNLAEDIVAIFTEIFNDESKFPMRDIGCFNWRNTIGGSQSQHSFGTCIDINSNENYYISSSGRILAGKLWAPGENPYSITPDGIVVETFRKYGWLWGGSDWGEGYAKDYMHMTYLGG